MPKDSPRNGNRVFSNTWSVIFLLAVILASASHALAHRVILFAYVEGDRVYTESYFSDGKRCQDSRIEVFDSFGNKLLEGKTDNNGEFSFNPPQKTDLKIILTASMGHRDEYTIPAGELQGEAAGKPAGLEPQKAVTKVSQAQKGSPPRQLTPREALEEKLKPVMRFLSKPRTEGISFVQVMGGIGFIFGIMGIILYFRGRKGT
jgi:nickel transport protein